MAHQLQKACIAVDDIIYHVPIADRLKVLPCTVNFGFLNESELHGGYGAFRFGDEIDVLDGAFIECNRPVRIIMSNRRRDSAWSGGLRT